MHRLWALHRHWGVAEVEGDLRITIGKGRRKVRRNSVHREITCLDSTRVHRITQVDNEICRLGIDDGVTCRNASGHRKTHQLSIGEGILLR